MRIALAEKDLGAQVGEKLDMMYLQHRRPIYTGLHQNKYGQRIIWSSEEIISLYSTLLRFSTGVMFTNSGVLSTRHERAFD